MGASDWEGWVPKPLMGYFALHTLFRVIFYFTYKYFTWQKKEIYSSGQISEIIVIHVGIEEST